MHLIQRAVHATKPISAVVFSSLVYATLTSGSMAQTPAVSTGSTNPESINTAAGDVPASNANAGNNSASNADEVLIAKPIPKRMQDRPFRLGYIKIDEYLDRQKPLAAVDGAGWTVNSDLLIGSFADRWIGALSLTGRKVQWWFDGKTDLTTPPGSFGSSVVLGFRDGRLFKLDALSGKRQWLANLDSFSERPMLLAGTTLYVVTAAQVLYAIDFQSGKTLWLYDGGFPDGLSIRGGAKPIIYDNQVIYGLASGELVAVNVDNGKLAWRYNPAYNEARFHGVVGEMVIRNNRLLIARYDGLVASIDLSGSARQNIWQEQLSSLSSSAFRNGRYYVGGVNGDVYSFDADNGRRVWRTVTDATIMSITPGETALFIGAGNGRVSALDSANGNMIWHDQPGGSLASPPVLQEKAIYFTTGLRSIYAYKID